MNKTRASILLLHLLFSTQLFAQWIEVEKNEFKQAILQSEKQMIEKSTYAYQTNYFFYELPTDQAPKLTYKGFIHCEQGKNFEIKQFDQLIVQNSQLNVTVDSIMKYVIIKDQDSLLYTRKTDFSYEDFMKSNCKVHRKKTNDGTSYLLEFPQNAKYRSAEISFDKKGLVSRYELMAGQEVIDDTGEKEKNIQPKMEIRYSHYEFGPATWMKNKKVVADIIEEREGLCYLSKAYSGYTLVDLRIKKEQ